MIRRTTMYFTVYPPTTLLFGWREYVRKYNQEISFILWCRVVRKTPRGLIVGNIEVQSRQVRPKWNDKTGNTGVIQATAVWEVSDG